MPTDLRRRCVAAGGMVALATACATCPALAQPTDERSAARAYFERGLELVNAGEFEAAAEAFELAYRTRPHYSVLYNLGQAYGTLGRPVEATLTLEKFLSEGGDKIQPARQEQVRQLIALHRSRIGELILEVEPAGAALFIDGRSAGSAPISGPILLAKGTHALIASKPGFSPLAITFEIAQGETASQTLRLEPQPVAPPTPALLTVGCDVPAAAVWIDGEAKGRTPLARPLIVPAGSRSVRFERPGYRTNEQVFDVAAGNAQSVDCRLVPDPALTRTEGALLEVRSEPPGNVYLDGKPYLGERVPPGLHSVRVERDGFHPWNSAVSFEPRARRQLLIALRPTRERLAAIEFERRQRNILAAGIGAASVVVGVGAALLYAWNGERYDDFASDRAAARRALAAGDVNAGSVHTWDDLVARGASIEHIDSLALGLGLAGVAGLTTAGIVWLTGER